MNDSRVLSEPASQPPRSLVVGIGASVGGLDALARFFDRVPTDSGMAFVIVAHDARAREEAWAATDELLSRHTDLPIHKGEAGMAVSPDHVYLIPSGTPLTVSDGHLCLVSGGRARGEEAANSIDVFFRALAEQCGARAAAVLLSGCGADGSQGLADVHDAGGLVVLHDAASESVGAAPAGAVDWVLAPGEMPRVLAEHARKRAPARTSESRGIARPAKRSSASYATQDRIGTLTALLDRYLPPSLLLSDAGEVLHAFNGASRFLKPRGESIEGLDVLEAVEADLRGPLGAALRSLAHGASAPTGAIASGVRAVHGADDGDDTREARYDVTIDRAHGGGGPGPLLVSFTRRGAGRTSAPPFEHSEIRRVPPPSDDDAGMSSAKELESLLASLSDAVYFKDASGKFLRTNQAMAERLGVSNPHAAVGKTAHDMPNSAAALALHRDDAAVIASGEAQHFRLERWGGPEGAVEWALVTRLPLRNRAGEVGGLVGVFHDVTEQKRAEEKVQEAVRRRDQFLAMLSHELRNPLGAIVTATSILKKQLTESEHARPLAILQRQSLQMAHLLDDLLEANRVTENTIELRRETVDLRAIALEAAEASRPFMAAHRLTFVADLAPGPVWIHGDPTRLLQIQTNLLQNATKYTPAGGHVHFELRREHDQIVLRVRDDGAGIPKEMLESVFDLFVQTGRKLDRSQGGIGLGLTLVRSLVTMHGGTVTAHSEGEGKGAEFVVLLPLAAAPIGEPAVAPARPRSRLPKHAKIAIIEDSADNRELLAEALTAADFECKTANNGVDGLILVDAFRPDVAIIDLGLPGMNGFELARRLRAEPRYAGIRLVALSGYGMREDHTRALAAGFDDHLVKPIEPAVLVKHLESEPPDREP